MVTPPSPHRSALEKTVSVVEALAHGGRLSDIARQTDLPVSTAHRILQELLAVGWAREGSSRSYSLGARLLSLPARSGGSDDLVRLAHPVLRELAAKTGRTIHLGMIDGDQLVYLDKIEGRRAYTMKSRIGGSIPLHCTAIGKAVLSVMHDDEVRGVAERTGLPAQTAQTLSDPAELVRHLREVRARRYAVDDRETQDEIRCVGAVVVDQHGEPIGGVSVSSLVYDLSAPQVRQLAPLVIASADRISQAISGEHEAASPS